MRGAREITQRTNSQPREGLCSPHPSVGESKGPDTSTKGNEVRRVAKEGGERQAVGLGVIVWLPRGSQTGHGTVVKGTGPGFLTAAKGQGGRKR